MPLRSQALLPTSGGSWTVGFDHLATNLGQPLPLPVHPASHSITPNPADPGANPSAWITANPSMPLALGGTLAPTPHPGMNTVHVCLIPSGVHRGEVLVIDGNLTNYGTRAYQPWSIVNPYWPQANPNSWPGQPPVSGQYRFHNALERMPTYPAGGTIGELFCGGQCWLSDGRLLFAGGTKRYPIQTGTPANPGPWEGAPFVYLWDSVPSLPGRPSQAYWVHLQ